jgi:hypothetical protein
MENPRLGRALNDTVGTIGTMIPGEIIDRLSLTVEVASSTVGAKK